jgi:multidrug efflux pump subunit AcrA (membrane-fusion protein)
MGRRNLARQRGQALLVVLGFVAALLLIVWAALSLASGAFLGQGNVRADTRETYALDAGLAYAIEVNDSAAKGIGCIDTNPPNLTLPYVSGTITVVVAIKAAPGCKVNKPTYNITVAASGTNRPLNAQIVSSNAGKKASWTINWEQYQ